MPLIEQVSSSSDTLFLRKRFDGCCCLWGFVLLSVAEFRCVCCSCGCGIWENSSVTGRSAPDGACRSAVLLSPLSGRQIIDSWLRDRFPNAGWREANEVMQEGQLVGVCACNRDGLLCYKQRIFVGGRPTATQEGTVVPQPGLSHQNGVSSSSWCLME